MICCKRGQIQRGDRTHLMAVIYTTCTFKSDLLTKYYIMRGQVPSAGSDILYLKYIRRQKQSAGKFCITREHARIFADRRNPQIYMPKANLKASKHSESEAGRRIDAYLLGTASGRIFSCRVLEIASGLLSLRVKAKDFMHAYFRKMNWEVLMQLSLQQTL